MIEFNQPKPRNKHRNNQNFKKLKVALSLQDGELAEWMGVSKSKISAWSRKVDAVKNDTGRLGIAGNKVSRYRVMRDHEFDLFCNAVCENLKVDYK